MTDQALVLRKLAVLREHLQRARRRRPDTLDAFLADDDRQDAAALAILVALQEATDIAFHIAADEGYGLPSSAREAFALLAEHGILAADLSESMARGAALRNRLAHGYASVDRARLWQEMPAGLDALQQYSAAISRFLGESANG